MRAAPLAVRILVGAVVIVVAWSIEDFIFRIRPLIVT
jgi:hypothetical protein